MSDAQNAPKRKRSVINSVKVVNDLRKAKGLPPVRKTAKAKAVKITAGLKMEVTRLVVGDLFPGALTDHDYVIDTLMGKKIAKEVELRLNRILSGKEPVPAYTEVTPAPKAATKPKTAPQVAAKPQTETKPKTEAKPKAEAKPKTEVKSAAAPKAKPEAKAPGSGAPKGGSLKPTRIVKGKSE